MTLDDLRTGFTGHFYFDLVLPYALPVASLATFTRALTAVRGVAKLVCYGANEPRLIVELEAWVTDTDDAYAVMDAVDAAGREALMRVVWGEAVEALDVSGLEETP